MQDLKLPFGANQTRAINELLLELNNDQKQWLAGYLTGLNAHTSSLLQILGVFSEKPAFLADNKLNSGGSITILYGTRSGNSLKAAKQLVSCTESEGLPAKLINLNEYNPRDIKKENIVFIVVSTDGEGEPPMAAEEFYNFIMSKKVPRLEHLQYSVLALGDSSYRNFCKIGRDIDLRLNELGARALSERVDCDVEFEEKAKQWAEKALEQLLKLNKSGITAKEPSAIVSSKTKTGTRENPAKAIIQERINLNGRGSTKSTWHIELVSSDGSEIQYQPGDALGVICQNREEFVDELIGFTGFNPETAIQTDSGEKSLRTILLNEKELSLLNVQVVEAYAKILNNKDLHKLIEQKDELFRFIYGRDVLDLLHEFPASLSPEELLSVLRKIQPRLYSIASSYHANPGEVHLTVGQVNYSYNNRLHFGTCSTLLSNQSPDEPVSIYVDENISFRLPDNDSTPLIMIGAGTGIAPYRAFMQERELNNSPGKNWLFFGERNFTTDFLYQTEWLKLLKSKTLTRLDVAFSRDQVEKVYIQHKLLEHKKELFSWIEKGAHVYLCGDKDHMAHDVKKAIGQLIASETGFSEEKTQEYFKNLRKQGRFHEDVY